LRANVLPGDGGGLGKCRNSHASEQHPQERVDPRTSCAMNTRMCEYGAHVPDPSTNGGGRRGPAHGFSARLESDGKARMRAADRRACPAATPLRRRTAGVEETSSASP
jgi:hypothetical protein